MLQLEWNGYDFSVQQYGYGVFLEDMAGHSHSKNSYELHYITDGEGVLTTEETSYPLRKGNFFVTGPNVYHQQSTNPQKPLTEIFIFIQASEKKTKDAMVASFLERHFFFCKNNELEIFFKKVVNEKEMKRWGCDNVTMDWLRILLTEITRLYLPEILSNKENIENFNDRRFLLIDNAFIFHPESITLRQLAEDIGLCERQTQRLLKKYYGKTFLEKKAEALANRK